MVREITFVVSSHENLVREYSFFDYPFLESRSLRGNLFSFNADNSPMSNEEEKDVFREYHLAKKILKKTVNRKGEIVDERGYRLMDEISEVEGHIFRRNTGLILSVYKQLQVPRRLKDEAQSEANLTVLKCIRAFDCERGYKFSTLLTTALRRTYIRLMKSESSRRKHFSSLENNYECTDFSDFDLLERETRSLERALYLKDNSVYGGLTQRECELIGARFPQTGERPLSFKKIAKSFGCCPQNVHRLQSSAFSKLRAKLQSA